MICFCTFFAAQFYPRIYTLVATSVLMGLGTGSLWSAICTYITKISSIYAELVGEKTDIIVSKFFGIVFMFFQSSKLWGSLISSLVLSVEVKDANVTEKALHCGYNSCNAESVGHSNSSYSGGSEGSVPSNLYILATIFLIASLLAPVIIVIFVDPLSRFINIDESRSRSKSSLQLLAATFNHLRHPYQLLLIPISAVVGFNTGILMADYTAAYISCVLGVHMVGYIIVCFGASSAVCALGMSLLVKVLGLVTVFTLGFLINLGLILVMIFWVPQPDDMIWFFIIGGIWGLSDAIWQTQVTVLYAVVFPKQMDEAFTNSVLWMCFGYSASYASSSVLCLNSKVIIFIILLVLGILGYYAIETIEKMGGLKKTADGNVIPLDRLIARAF
ncbi:UNC93-like protein [Procambarus clarkii]|uniref:UNC93-like protein n=1 Tax=Procambarus clarkii TaxID=6728 RepID=UPI0037440468